MAVIRSVRRGAKTYYYAVQSYRWGRVAHQKSTYLGRTRPPNPEELTAAIEREVWAETWFGQFDRIGREYRARRSQIPASVVEKEIRDFAIAFTYDTNRIEGSILNRQ